MKALNEWCQKRGRPNVVFEEMNFGPLHQQSWKVTCLEFGEVISASSATKKSARNECADKIMQLLHFDESNNNNALLLSTPLPVFTLALENVVLDGVPPFVGRVKYAALDVEWCIRTNQFICVQVAEAHGRVYVFTNRAMFEEYALRIEQFVLFAGTNDKKMLSLKHNTIDILDLLPAGKHGATPSLQRLVRHYFGKNLPKSEQTTFRANTGLSVAQIMCAATDAAATLDLYNCLILQQHQKTDESK